ncbi:MAG: hypothetical protein RLN60_03365 [Phycisphaerales bacterium]
MGYHIQQHDSEFSIRRGHVTEAFERLLAHFPKELEWATDLSDALMAFGWDTDDTYTWLWFIGEKHSDDHAQVFSLIAPFVESGSWIEMQGQEGEIWRWEFTDGELYEQEGVFAWTGRRERVPAPELPLTGEQAEIFGG